MPLRLGHRLLSNAPVHTNSFTRRRRSTGKNANRTPKFHPRAGTFMAGYVISSEPYSSLRFVFITHELPSVNTFTPLRSPNHTYGLYPRSLDIILYAASYLSRLACVDYYIRYPTGILRNWHAISPWDRGSERMRLERWVAF